MKKSQTTADSFPNQMKWVNYCVSGNKINRTFPRRWAATCCLLLGLFFSTVSEAQITPANCTQGCTSNDVQIQRSYLSDQAGNILPGSFVCPVIGTATVYLTLELTTKTPRVGVTIFTKIKTFTGGTIGTEVTGSPISQCFGITLNQPTNKVTFQQSFLWTCGTAIVMTDIFIGWGTGNSNFCTGTAFQCPATPSKCFALPPGSFVAIETPVPHNASATICSDAAGGTTATFNLNNITVTNSSGVTITWWDDYTAPSTFSNQILTLASYSTGSNTVYAKITSNSDVTVFSVSTVTLTVNQTPSLTITNPAAVCSPNTVDLTAAAVTAGSTLPVVTTLSYWTTQAATTALSTPSAVGAGTYYIKATCNTTPACSDIKSVVVTVYSTPTNPQVNLTQPTCANANGTVTVTSPLDGGGVDYEYSNNGGTYQDAVAFTVAGGAAYSITARNKNGQCVSTGAASGNMGAQPQTPANPQVNVTQPTCANANGTVTVTSPLDGGGVDYEYSNNGGTYQDGVSFTVAAGAAYSITARNKSSQCVSGSTSGTMGAQPQTPASPTTTYNAPACDQTTFSVTVGNVAAGAKYFITNKNGDAIAGVSPSSPNTALNTSDFTFSNIPAGSGFIVSVVGANDCAPTNAAAPCGTPTGTGSANRTAPAQESQTIDSKTTVRAYPNPFSRSVKFMITSPVKGRGTLEVYNATGQKIRTVHIEFIVAGIQIVEVSFPSTQVTNLIYVLRIGDKQVTGKLLKINQ